MSAPPCLIAIKMEPEEDETELPAFQSNLSSTPCLPSRLQIVETATNIREVYKSNAPVPLSINNLLENLTTVTAEPANPAIVWAYSSEILSNLEKYKGDWSDELKKMITDFLKTFLDNVYDQSTLKQFQFRLRGLSREEPFKSSFLFCTARYRIAQRLELMSLEAKKASSTKKPPKKKKRRKKTAADFIFSQVKCENGSDNDSEESSEDSSYEEDSDNDVISDDDIANEGRNELDNYAPNSLRILQLFEQNLKSNDLTTEEHSEFLHAYLNSLTKAATSCNDGPVTELIKEKIAKTLSRLFDATSEPNLNESIDWTICEKLLPIFIPKTLTYQERDCQSRKLLDISVIERFVPVIELILDDCLVEDFNNYVMKESFASDSNLADDERKKLREMFLDDLPQSDYSKDRLEKSANVLYELCQNMLKNSQCSFEKVVDLLKKIVLLDKRWANNKLLFKLANSLVEKLPTNFNKSLNMDLFTFLDELIILLSLLICLSTNDVGRLHFELAIIRYIYYSNLKRIFAKNPLNKYAKLSGKPDEMLLAAQVHFKIASEAETPQPEHKWIARYFLGKIGEKLGDKLTEVVGHYQKSAKLLESCIGRSIAYRNAGFCELFYRIHRFLDKKRKEAYELKQVNDMKKVVTCLALFVENKPSKRRSSMAVDLSATLSDDNTERELSSGLESLNEKAKQSILNGYANVGDDHKRHTLYRRLELAILNNQNQYDIASSLFKNELTGKRRLIGLISMKNFGLFSEYLYLHGSIDFHVTRFVCLLLDNVASTFGLNNLARFLKDLLDKYNDLKVDEMKHDTSNKLSEFSCEITPECAETLIGKCTSTLSKLIDEGIGSNISDRNLVDLLGKTCITLKQYKIENIDKFCNSVKNLKQMLVPNSDEQSNVESSHSSRAQSTSPTTDTIDVQVSNEDTHQLSTQSPQLPSSSTTDCYAVRIAAKKKELEKKKMARQRHFEQYMKNMEEENELEIKIVKEEMEQFYSQQTEEMEQLKEENARIKHIETEVGRLKEENSSLKNDNTNLKEENARLRDENTNLKNDHAVLNTKLKRIQNFVLNGDSEEPANKIPRRE